MKNVSIRGRHKLANQWERTPYVIQSQPDKNIPVYVIRHEHGSKNTRTVHGNLLLSISFLPINEISGEKTRRVRSNRETGAAAYETASEIPDNALNKSDENGCQDESGVNISDSGSTSDDDSVILMVTKNQSLNSLALEFVPSQSGSHDFTQNNDTRDHLLYVRGPDDAFDIDNSFQSEFDDSSIEVSQSELRSDAERSYRL